MRPRCRSCATCTRGGRSGSALRRLVSIRHKPLFCARELECVEGDRQVDDAWRGDRAEDAERRLARRVSEHDAAAPRRGPALGSCGSSAGRFPAPVRPRRPAARSRRRASLTVQADDERVDARDPHGRSRSASRERARDRRRCSQRFRHERTKRRLVSDRHKRSRPARGYAFGLICAITRKLGRSSGTSWNSGFRQPSSSPRLS